MKRTELVDRLRYLLWEERHGHMDPERSHGDADAALLKFINDAEVTEIYNKLTAWCA